MPTVTVPVTDVRLVGTNVYAPGEVVGTDPWNDDTTDTYAQTTVSLRTDQQGQYSVGTIAPTPNLTTLTEMSLTVQMMAMNSGGTGAPLSVGIDLRDSDFNQIASFGDPTDPFGAFGQILLDSGFPVVYDVDLVPVGGLSAVESAFRDGCDIAAIRLTNDGDTNPSDYVLWVFKVSLTLTYAGGMPPLRRTQRDDLRNSGLNSRQRSLRNSTYL